MEFSIQQVARLAGTTSRALRHYDEIGLLPPSRVGSNGYRYYDEAALLRLQRVLLLRNLGLGLPQISAVLAKKQSEEAALETHLSLLTQEQEQLTRRINAVQHTLNSLNGKERLVAESMFDGFDHTQYREEVEERWGAESYARSDRWWRSMNAEDRTQWQEQVNKLNREWREAAQASERSPESPEAQSLAHRHIAWLRSVPGTPASEQGGDLACYVRSLAEMYVADERFAENYGGRAGAEFVRDALIHHLAHARADHR